jgi:TRAP-type uncharacterized transport system substrate-binding protein
VDRIVLTLCGFVLIASTSAFAQTADHRSTATLVNGVQQDGSNSALQLRHAMRDQVNAGLVTIISRGMEGTELWEATDLAASLGGARDNLRILPIAGKGALQNATDVVFARGVDIGIMQSDVLATLKRDPPFPGIENYVRYITKLYDEEVHVLAGAQIRSIEDLASKKVNLGIRDSGTLFTARAIFGALGVTVEETNFPQAVALAKLRRGEISALVCLTPKPAGLFRDLRPDENLHFVAIRPGGNLPQSYTSANLTAEDYPELIEANSPVSTVAVGTVLAAYNWPAGTERYGKVARFVGAFFARLHEMQVPPHHPKWHQIDLAAAVPGWTRFPAAEEWIKRAGLNEDETRHAAIPQQSGGSLSVQERNAIFAEFADYQRQKAALDPKQREALFAEFAEYQRRRGVARPDAARSALQRVRRISEGAKPRRCFGAAYAYSLAIPVCGLPAVSHFPSLEAANAGRSSEATGQSLLS